MAATVSCVLEIVDSINYQVSFCWEWVGSNLICPKLCFGLEIWTWHIINILFYVILVGNSVFILVYSGVSSHSNQVELVIPVHFTEPSKSVVKLYVMYVHMY